MRSDVRVDPRTRRTRDSLSGAMAELLTTMPLSRIGVAQLCRTAGVHRTTFYKHYDSVGEVAAGVVEEVWAGDDADAPTYLGWLGSVLDAVASRRTTLAAVLGSDGDPALVRAVCDRLVARAGRYLTEAVRAGTDLGSDVRTAARVVGFASYGALEAALDGDVDAGWVAALPLPWADVLGAGAVPARVPPPGC